MVIRKSLASLAVASLVFGSTVATAAPTAADRSGSDVAVSEGNVGNMGTFGLLLGLLILAGVIAVVASNDGNNTPTSP